MKLLLTSTGVSSQPIADSLQKLVGKKPEDTNVALIPTAAFAESGDKNWFIQQYTDLQRFGFSQVDIVDIAATDINWRSRLKNVDVVFIGGGNTFYLLDQIRKTGFSVWLKEHSDRCVYVGASAGSIVMTPTIALAAVEPGGDENIPGVKDLSGLGFVDFEVSPHTPEFMSHEANLGYSKLTKNILYGIDNNSAIEFSDGESRLIGDVSGIVKY